MRHLGVSFFESNSLWRCSRETTRINTSICFGGSPETDAHLDRACFSSSDETRAPEVMAVWEIIGGGESGGILAGL